MSTLTLSLLQSDLAWEDRDKNLSAFGRTIHSLRGKTELVVLPEMFSTGFSTEPESLAEDMEGPTVTWLKQMASGNKLVIAGSFIAKENGQFYNRMVWMQPNGQYGVYDKRHLFAYAGEHTQFSPGDRRVIASLKGWKINLQICYDLRFPVWARQTIDNTETAQPEYDLLLYVANWPEQRIQAWKTLLPARAIENQCFVVGVNRVGRDGKDQVYSGDSMVVDPLGQILVQGGRHEEIITVTLEKEKLNEVRKRLPFWRDADRFLIEP